MLIFAFSFACFDFSAGEEPACSQGCAGASTVCGEAGVLGFTGEGQGLPRLALGSLSEVSVFGGSEDVAEDIVEASMEPGSRVGVSWEGETLRLWAHRVGTAELEVTLAGEYTDALELWVVEPDDYSILMVQGSGSDEVESIELEVGEAVVLEAQAWADGLFVLGVDPRLWEVEPADTFVMERGRASVTVTARTPGVGWLRLGEFAAVALFAEMPPTPLPP